MCRFSPPYDVSHVFLRSHHASQLLPNWPGYNVWDSIQLQWQKKTSYLTTLWSFSRFSSEIHFSPYPWLFSEENHDIWPNIRFSPTNSWRQMHETLVNRIWERHPWAGSKGEVKKSLLFAQLVCIKHNLIVAKFNVFTNLSCQPEASCCMTSAARSSWLWKKRHWLYILSRNKQVVVNLTHCWRGSECRWTCSGQGTTQQAALWSQPSCRLFLRSQQSWCCPHNCR